MTARTKDTSTSVRLPEDLLRELEGIAGDAGCELAHVELKGNVLRLVLDRPDEEGGVTLKDCETVSRQASALLDVADAIPSRYVLEVSSPGLDRQLYRPRDYARFEGRLARVTFRTAEVAKKTVVGRLTEYRPEDGGRVTVVEPDTGERHEMTLDDIQVARLEIEL